MKLENINTYLIGRFMFNVSKQKVPESFIALFTKNNEFHTYSTRSAEHYHTPSIKLDLSKTAIKYKGAVVWNLIDKTVTNLDVSVAVFKRNLMNLVTVEL